MRELRGHKGNVISVHSRCAYNDKLIENTFISSACDDENLILWDIRTSNAALHIPHHQDTEFIGFTRLHPFQNIAALAVDDTLVLYDLRKPQAILKELDITTMLTNKKQSSEYGSDYQINDFQFHPLDPSLILCPLDSGELLCIDLLDITLPKIYAQWQLFPNLCNTAALLYDTEHYHSKVSTLNKPTIFEPSYEEKEADTISMGNPYLSRERLREIKQTVVCGGFDCIGKVIDFQNKKVRNEFYIPEILQKNAIVKGEEEKKETIPNVNPPIIWNMYGYENMTYVSLGDGKIMVCENNGLFDAKKKNHKKMYFVASHQNSLNNVICLSGEKENLINSDYFVVSLSQDKTIQIHQKCKTNNSLPNLRKIQKINLKQKANEIVALSSTSFAIADNTNIVSIYDVRDYIA